MATTSNSLFKTITVWVLRVLLALLFLAAAFFKLSGQPMMVAEFQTIGLGQWFRYLTGTLEVIGALTLLVPRVSVFGGLLLLFVDAGAFVTQAFVLHGDIIHTIVIGLLIALVVFLQKDKLMALVGRPV